MIQMQDWLAPLLGSIVIILIPLVIALMCNTIVRRMRSNDLRAHEQRLSRKTRPTRKEDEKTRLKVEEQWQRIESYARARNLCLLVAEAVVAVNLGFILLVLLSGRPMLSVSLLVVLAIIFVASIRFMLRKPERPIWATTPGYYRDLDSPGPRGRRQKEGSA